MTDDQDRSSTAAEQPSGTSQPQMDQSAPDQKPGEQPAATAISGLDDRPIVLVGMMGAGKTTVGRRLAARLGRGFVDSDAEIETAAGMSIPDIFASHGEPDFRAGEARVIARLLKQPNMVIGTGGGAFMSAETRELIRQSAVSVWLRADFDLLFARVSRRANRPLLQTANPEQTLRDLMDARYPTYAEADITILSRDVPHDVIAGEIAAQIENWAARNVPEGSNEHE